MRKKTVTVKGSVILSTIKTMESFGDIGGEFLADHGVIEINENDDYPYELRNELHKTVLDRFGEIALTAFGFNHAESFQPVVLEETQKEYTRNIRNLEDDVRSKNNKALKNILNCLSSCLDINMKKNSYSTDIKYGAKVDCIDENFFRLSMVTASVAYQKYFYLGVLRFHCARLFEKFWKYELVIDDESLVEGKGYTKLVFGIKFLKSASDASQSEIVINSKMHIRDLLIRNVLLDSEKQKKESEKQKIKVENLLKQLGKYTPPQIKKALEKGDYDSTIATRRKKISMFFSDIKNFTSTSEGLQPEDLTKYLNEYFSEMTTIALDCGATIDKYIGDAMMVFFGDPESKGEREDARACVEMALRMQDRMKHLQGKWSNEGFADPFQVRMGINTGYCNVGNFGSEQRLTYTIIGGEVNVAQRLEASADANGILMSYETYAHAQDMIKVEERDAIKMKGISREIKLFSVVGRKNDKKNKNCKVKKEPSKKEPSRVSRLEKDVLRIENNLHNLNEKVNLVLKKL